MESELSDWVLEAGGEMVSTNSSKIVDFMIVPFNSDVVKSKKSKEVVSNLWLEGNKTAWELHSRFSPTLTFHIDQHEGHQTDQHEPSLDR